MSAGDVDTTAVARLGNALQVFSAGVGEAIQATTQAISITQRQIADRRQFWTAELRRREAELERAQRALDACLRSGGPDDPPPYCGAEEAAAWRSEQAVNEAREALERIAAIEKAVADAVAKYEPVAREMVQASDEGVSRARAELDDTIRRVEEYNAGAVGGLGRVVDAAVVAVNAFVADLPEPAVQGLSATANSIAPGTGTAFEAIQVTAQVERWRKDVDPAASEALKHLPGNLIARAGEAVEEIQEAAEELSDQLLDRE